MAETGTVLLEKGTQIALIQGVFGDMENCHGMLEEVVTPPEGGTFMRVWGCTYLYKVYPAIEIVEGLSLAKSMLSLLPREIIGKSYVLRAALVLLFLCSRKWFFYYLNIYIVN